MRLRAPVETEDPPPKVRLKVAGAQALEALQSLGGHAASIHK